MDNSAPWWVCVALMLALCACGGGGGESGPNQAPTATSAALLVLEDSDATPITPDVSDPDAGDTHTFAVLQQPGRGTASVVGSQLVYTPDADFGGPDSFPYRATDGGGLSVDGVCTVTVTPVNDPPVSTRARLTVLESTSTAAILPFVADPDVGDTFTFSVVTPPPIGSAAPAGDGLVYTAPPGASGTTSFVYRATDAAGLSVTGSATVRMYEDSALALAITASTQNPDGTSNRNRSEACGHFATIEARRADDGTGGETDVTVDCMIHWPSDGEEAKAIAVLVAGGDLDPSISGSDATGEVTAAGANFLVRCAQLLAESGFVCVSLVRPTDRPTPGAPDPVTDIDHYRLSVDHAVDIARVLERLNTRGLNVLIAGTSRGALSASAGNGLCARVSFSSPVTSPSGSNPTRLYLSHSGHPRLQATHVTTPAHVLRNTLDACGVSEADGATVWFNALTAAGNPAGSASVTGGFQDSSEPNPCASRTHHGYLGIEPGTVAVVAQWMNDWLASLGGNQPPRAAPITVSTQANHLRNIDLSTAARDPESDSLIYGLPYPETVRGGTATVAGSVVEYTPAPGFLGTDRFVYTVTTADGSRALATVTVQVTTP